MSGTLTAPRRFTEQITFAGERIKAHLQDSLYVLKDSTVDTQDVGPMTRDSYEGKPLSFWRSWFSKPSEKKHELPATLPIWIHSAIAGEIEGLAFIVRGNEPKGSSGVDWLALLSDDNWTFSEVMGESSVTKDIPSPLDQAVNQVISLAKGLSVSRTDEPQVEMDPENEGEWWVTIPVWCQGTVDEAFGVYYELTKLISARISPSDRERIRIDFQVEE